MYPQQFQDFVGFLEQPPWSLLCPRVRIIDPAVIAAAVGDGLTVSGYGE